jgi:hypothetical protein
MIDVLIGIGLGLAIAATVVGVLVWRFVREVNRRW